MKCEEMIEILLQKVEKDKEEIEIMMRRIESLEKDLSCANDTIIELCKSMATIERSIVSLISVSNDMVSYIEEIKTTKQKDGGNNTPTNKGVN